VIQSKRESGRDRLRGPEDFGAIVRRSLYLRRFLGVSCVSSHLDLTGIKAVHTGVMRAEAKTVRPSVSLPAKLASQGLFDLAGAIPQ